MKVLMWRMFLGLVLAGSFPLTVTWAQPAVGTSAAMSRPANGGHEAVAESKPAPQPFEDKRTKTDLPVMGKWGKSGVDMADCVQQLHNYYYRLVAYELGKKVEAGDKREELLEDLAAVRLGMDSGKIRDRDPNRPQRWKTWLTPEDLAEIDQMQKKYQKDVQDDCYQRFGQ